MPKLENTLKSAVFAIYIFITLLLAANELYSAANETRINGEIMKVKKLSIYPVLKVTAPDIWL